MQGHGPSLIIFENMCSNKVIILLFFLRYSALGFLGVKKRQKGGPNTDRVVLNIQFQVRAVSTKVEKGQKQSLDFVPILSNSVTLCSQQGHQRPGV